ncbi:hypothetical protein NZK33_07785 [Cyanobium sp. FGCU-6]|nr:hypothetical protein [Cyanobium sp. FGCU6]
MPDAPEPDRLGAREIAFIAARDSIYLASLTETGAPYIQHRGGPLGFLQVLDERTLGFADYGGNRQLLTTGHLRADAGAAEAERLFRIHVEALDWNCPQFITPRFSAAQVESALQPLRQRIAQLEEELGRLRSCEPHPDPADGT